MYISRNMEQWNEFLDLMRKAFEQGKEQGTYLPCYLLLMSEMRLLPFTFKLYPNYWINLWHNERYNKF